MPIGSVCRPDPRVTMARLAAVVALMMSLGGCAGLGGLAEIGLGDSAAREQAELTGTDLEKATQYWGKQHAANPRNGKAALAYAQNLKALGRKRDALSVMQASYVYNADNREFASEYGRLALEHGQVAAAVQLLERADDPAKPDWRVLSARGAALAKQGNYKAALPHLERARTLAPNQASVLNNLALLYTLDGHADKAEALLRQAAQGESPDSRVHQNLALVVSLQNRDGVPAPAGPPVAAPRHLASAPVQPSRTMDPEQVIRAALKAEAARTAAAPRSTPISTATVSH